MAAVPVRASNQCTTLAGLGDALSQMTALALQHEAPVDEVVRLPFGTRFETAGMTDDPEVSRSTSLADYLGWRLDADYLSPHARAQVGLPDSRTSASLNHNRSDMGGYPRMGRAQRGKERPLCWPWPCWGAPAWGPGLWRAWRARGVPLAADVCLTTATAVVEDDPALMSLGRRSTDGGNRPERRDGIVRSHAGWRGRSRGRFVARCAQVEPVEQHTGPFGKQGTRVLPLPPVRACHAKVTASRRCAGSRDSM